MNDPTPPSENPFARFVCGSCRDVRRVAGPEGTAGSIPCPVCGTDEGRRAVFARSTLIPSLHVLDLTDEELALFRDWRRPNPDKPRGFHELDCLRWIEGRRYIPANDPVFLADLAAALDSWRQRTSRDPHAPDPPKNPDPPKEPRRRPEEAPSAPRQDTTAAEPVPCYPPQTDGSSEAPGPESEAKTPQPAKMTGPPFAGATGFGETLDFLDGIIAEPAELPPTDTDEDPLA